MYSAKYIPYVHNSILFIQVLHDSFVHMTRNKGENLVVIKIFIKINLFLTLHQFKIEILVMH